MKDVYLKEEFKKWMKKQIKNNGKSYHISTSTNYSNALKNACSEIENLNLDNNDLFIIDSLSEFKKIEHKIRSNKDFVRVDMKYGKGCLSAGISKYREFLKERTSLNKVTWFVGAVILNVVQVQRFIKEGIWVNGYDDKHIDLVNSIKIGDRIAIKSTYTKKKNLPFDNKNTSVAVMGIKAIGIVTHNYNDGHKISVDWEVLNPIKEWYFSTVRSLIRKVKEEDGWMYKNLIDFAFNKGTQDISRFLNEPYWGSKYGYNIDSKFDWTVFYEETAKALLQYKENRTDLIIGINKIYDKIEINNPLIKKDTNGIKKPLTDICPFTVFALFNRGITNQNRILIMQELADFLKVTEKLPKSLDGVPVLNNMRTLFFGDDNNNREKDDIDNLWYLFELAIELAEDDSNKNKEAFIELYDHVIGQYGILWNITFGLYWIKPWDYLTLDNASRTALEKNLRIEIPKKSLKKACTGLDYITIVELLKENFTKEDYIVHSFPELSYKAWKGEFEIITEKPIDIIDNNDISDINEAPIIESYEPYTKLDFLSEVFISDDTYETILSILDRKKNLILQGPPGVGKTFAAKRLAYSIIGEKDASRIKMLQFHQSYAYEDFIMGYKPNGTGFELREGPFYQFCKHASENIDKSYFFIIDEINRGNMSKIFGELMVLIESDKRGEELSLTYSDNPFSIPENLYIIGMMNTADRSLALIDYALRRRFCFFELEPAFETKAFKNHLLKLGASEELIEKIRTKLGKINLEITKDVNLGKDFKIGHSYFCDYKDSDKWFKEIINYEIKPLIKEYWFDDEEKAKNNIEELLGG